LHAREKQINKLKSYFSGASQSKIKPDLLNAYFVTGFIDAEGSFIIRVRKNLRSKIG
jgi:hypothetical protein